MKIVRLIVSLIAIPLVACATPPTPEPTATLIPTAIVVPPTPTLLPSTPTPVPTWTPPPTATPKPTDTVRPTETFTSIPTDAPRPTATPTARAVAPSVATPTMGLSAALITLADLPPGFRTASEEELKILAALNTDARKQSVHYFSSDGSTILTHSITYSLTDDEVFSVLSLILQSLAPGKASMFWDQDTNVTESTRLTDLDNLGDMAVGATFITQPAPDRLNRHDGILILRENAMSSILLSYPEGQPPTFTVKQLAQLVDDRLASELDESNKP